MTAMLKTFHTTRLHSVTKLLRFLLIFVSTDFLPTSYQGNLYCAQIPRHFYIGVHPGVGGGEGEGRGSPGCNGHIFIMYFLKYK